MSVAAPAPARAPVYGPIHKLHRFALASAVAKLGAADFADDQQAIEMVALVRQQIAFGRAHLSKEDRHVHPLLRTQSAGHVAELEAAHDEHEQDFAALEALTSKILRGPAGERLSAGHELYLQFARFVARDFAHMDFEERVVEPAIHATVSDAEIHAAHQAAVADASPEELLTMRDLAGHALNRNELEMAAGLLNPQPPAEGEGRTQPEISVAAT